MPEVGVIIVARNRAHILGTAIKSALDQTFKDIEIVVVDDGSTDETFDVARSFNGVRAYRIGPNGIAWARNYAAQKTKCEWLAFLDSDDRWLPEKLEVQLGALKKSGLAFSSTDAFLVNEAGKRVAKLSERNKPFSGHVFFKLVKSNFICSPCVMIHKNVFWQKGGFDPRMVSAEDYHLWLRVAYTHPLLYISLPLVEYCDHSQRRMQRRQVEVTDWTIRAIEDVIYSFELDPQRFEFRRRLGELNYYAAIWHLAKSQFYLARRHLLKAFINSPIKAKKLKSFAIWLASLFSDDPARSALSYLKKNVNVYWPWAGE